MKIYIQDGKPFVQIETTEEWRKFQRAFGRELSQEPDIAPLAQSRKPRETGKEARRFMRVLRVRYGITDNQCPVCKKMFKSPKAVTVHIARLAKFHAGEHRDFRETLKLS